MMQRCYWCRFVLAVWVIKRIEPVLRAAQLHTRTFIYNRWHPMLFSFVSPLPLMLDFEAKADCLLFILVIVLWIIETGYRISLKQTLPCISWSAQAYAYSVTVDVRTCSLCCKYLCCIFNFQLCDTLWYLLTFAIISFFSECKDRRSRRRFCSEVL